MLLGGQIVSRLPLVETRWLAPVANLPCSLRVLIEQPLEPAVFYSFAFLASEKLFPIVFLTGRPMVPSDLSLRRGGWVSVGKPWWPCLGDELRAGVHWGCASRWGAGLCDKRECSHPLPKIALGITGDLQSYRLPHFSTNSFLKMDY